MKRFLIPLLLLLAAACGNETITLRSPLGVDLSAMKILWQGYTHDADKPVCAVAFDMGKAFDETVECLLPSFPLMQFESEPYIIKVDGYMDCSGIWTSACYDPNWNIVILGGDAFNEHAFRHEIVHWGTRLQNKDHDSIYFTSCTQYSISIQK